MKWCLLDDCSESVQSMLSSIESDILYGGVAIVLILAMLILLRRRQPAKILAYHSENGRVMVSRSAILELIQSACAQIEQVHRPTVRIRTKRGICHLRVGIKLQSSGRLRDLENVLQQHLRQALTETLGIEKLGTIDITATGFKDKKGSKPVDLNDNEDDLSDFH